MPRLLPRGQWLSDEGFFKALEVSALGVAMLGELKKAHEPLAELKNKRAKANARLEKAPRSVRTT